MTSEKVTQKTTKSIFSTNGFNETINELLQDIQTLYKSDSIPWVVGYSGGKDSTAALQLVWLAIEKLPEDERKKPVHVISTDTLVENPIVAQWVNKSLTTMQQSSEKLRMPIIPHRLTPEISNSFWVALLGKGYPSPRPKFRWCTDRLKIQPSNTFIRNVVKKNGEAILVLGTRKAESSRRAATMEKYERQRTRDKLSPNAKLPNCLVYSPIEDWSNDDVWTFLLQKKNPWGHRNKDLLSMYQGATAGGECPLVVDSNTRSCGDSRFGCWVCTLVSEDKSMSAMIQNDDEKEWMLPLLQFRNLLAERPDRKLRDYRRLSGRVQLFHDRPIPGPYKQDVREAWLKRLLEIQRWINEESPEEIRGLEIITLPELDEIRRIWVIEKHEIEDSLPRIYEQILSVAYPGGSIDDTMVFGSSEMTILKDICEDNDLLFQLTRELLDVEKHYNTMASRSGLFVELEKSLLKSVHDTEEDAVNHARELQRARQAAQAMEYKQLKLFSGRGAEEKVRTKSNDH